MFKRFNVSMFVPGMAIDRDTLNEKSLGGSESAGLYMARALTREGASVEVFCNTRTSWHDSTGLRHHPAGEWPLFAKSTPHDICIAQRLPEALSQRTNARLNILWCHDLALGRQDRAFRSALWNVDRVVVLSDFMRQQYKEVYDVDDALYFVSRNGVDLPLFHELGAQAVPRDRKKLVFAARPERGLDVLLRHVMPRLLAKDPELRLFIAGYDNRPEEWNDYYAECDRLATQLGDRVVRLGCLGKRDLYRHYLSAGVYVYPTPSPALPTFREVSCISVMECQAAGLPVVTSAIGALSETLAPGAGVLVQLDPTGPEGIETYADLFSEAVLTLVHDDTSWNLTHTAGLEAARELDWSGIARDWLGEFERMIRARTESESRLLRYLWRHSDIVAAKQLLERDTPTSDLSTADRARITKLLSPWAFMDEAQGYRRHYEQIGARHKDASRHESVETKSRFEVLEPWLRQRAGEITRVLDYGCGQGSYAIGLAERLGHLEVHGVDIDRFSIEVARRSAAARGVDTRVTFSTWTHDSPEELSTAASQAAATFDCALLQEVLGHVPEPWAVIEGVERRIRVGGKIYLAVPYGPWEYEFYRRSTDRCHIWHLDEHDIRDMLGAKSDLNIDSLYESDNSLTGEPQGWWVISYTADHRPVPAIDLDRHLWLQRPRETVSAAIIAGPGSEDTLHWMLRSIQDVVDEVIVADCGMSAEARRIANQYDLTIIPGLDPRVTGFEQPRNLALDACSGDWCMWIDTDEKLVGGAALEKYLRANTFTAYALRQHQFACDGVMPPDLPCRLFRRRAYEGRSIRFTGAIHEQPELGLNEGPGPHIALPDVHIAHVGYLDEGTRRGRFARNWPLLQLDQQRYPQRLIQKHFIMRDKMHLVRYSLEQNGGHVTDEIRTMCRAIVELYRTYFLAKTALPSIQPLEYYSEALTVLGEGFEAAFQVAADKTQAHPNGAQRFRFASVEDLQAVLSRAAADKATRFESKWW